MAAPANARPSTWRLVNARVPACLTSARAPADEEGLVRADLTIADKRIASIVAHMHAESALPPDDTDAQGGIVMPCFIDAHVHLDKGHISPRAPNPDGSFAAALATVAADRAAHWSNSDVRARMEFGLKCAYAHGTRAMRTHLDSLGPQTRISWPAFAGLREAWADRIDLHASPLFGIDHALDDAHLRDVTAMLDTHGGPQPTLGAVTYMVPALQEGLNALFRLASDKGWALDFHADETNDPAAQSLRFIAETALRFKFRNRILVGHCCSLALQGAEAAARTIELVAKAGIAIVSLPMCNMYLQDRKAGRTPRWRGVTPLRELKAAGVSVMIASDNTRDPFYAYGDLDMLEVWREGTRILHLDHPFGAWVQSVTAAPAQALGLNGASRLDSGASADFILFRARSLSELFSRPQTDRRVFRHGRRIRARLPDYRELDAREALLPGAPPLWAVGGAAD